MNLSIEPQQSRSFGIYIHIPFCAHRCDYCAFATWTDRHGLMGHYAAACRREIEAASLPPATSVFFGGGTPSLLPAEVLMSILEATERAPGAEVTVECNPETVTPALLAAYRAGGVNRLSFGVQSMVPHVLAGLGRRHHTAAVEPAVREARRAGFESISLDLILGGAGETSADWAATVDAAVALAPDHVSAYALTVEPGTPLANDRWRWPDDDDQADKYQDAEQRLAAAGFDWYEISNWARPGHQCRHNRLYWAQGVYRGIGCAAHSHQAGRRWWNVRTPERYLALIDAGASPVAGEERLDAEQRELEALQLGLRTSAGVPDDALPDDEAMGGLADRSGGRAVLTVAGRLLYNEAAARLRVRAPLTRR